MILLEPGKARSVLAGRALTLEDSDPGRYRKGRTYPLGVHRARELCKVEILDVDLDAGQITVRLARTDQPRLLARNPGSQRADYVSDPSKAMRNEPEPVRRDELERMTLAARRRREAELAAFAGRVTQEAQRLEEGADRAQRRRLRAVIRVASILR